MGIFTAIALISFAGVGRAVRTDKSLAEVEHLIEIAGFGLNQVAVTGHRFTADADIFEALDLPRSRTLLSFDAKAAQVRIEQLPWVERASIERVMPDRLEVRITERVPFAVWHVGGQTLLIDKSGRVLSSAAANSFPALPRVAGAGAARQADTLMSLLATEPALQRQVVIAERVGGRRWTLRLADGGSIHLPADDSTEALARGWSLASAGLARGGDIDLRVPGRIIIGDRHGGAERVSEAAAARSTGGGS